jgi:hypothetical protein
VAPPPLSAAADALSEPVASLLADIRTLSSDNTRDQVAALSPDERAGWLRGLQAMSDAVSAASLVATEVADSRGDAEVLTGSTTTSWLRHTLRISGAEANDRVRVARSSRGLLSDAVAMLADGRTTWQHVRVIERGLRPVPAEHLPEASELLTALAEEASIADLRTAARHLGTVLDPDGALRLVEHEFERRHLTLSPLLDGMTALDGLLDAEEAALLAAALEPFLVPEGPDDRRSAGQRRADGLLQLVQSACDHRLTPTVGSERPQLQVVVDRQAGAQLARPGGGPATLHPVSVARIACDSTLTALLLDEHGVVTDLGRTQRLFSPQQRRVLAARDGGCRWTGCSRPAVHTDAHHVVSWLDGGPTDVANAILLCRRHHRMVHEGGWTLAPTDPRRGSNGPVQVTGPRGQTFVSSPRGP